MSTDNPYYIVVTGYGLFEKTLPGMPTPMLISTGGGEAWLMEGWQWRARDDQWDKDHKPADMPYIRVRVVRNLKYQGYSGYRS